MILAKAIFCDDGAIIVQFGSWSNVYDDPIEAADKFWEYLDQSQYDEDVARFWDGFEETEHVYGLLTVSVDDWPTFSSLEGHEIDMIASFFKRIRWNQERDEKDCKGGFKAVVKTNPLLWRWYENATEAIEDDEFLDGSRRIERCV